MVEASKAPWKYTDFRTFFTRTILEMKKRRRMEMKR